MVTLRPRKPKQEAAPVAKKAASVKPAKNTKKPTKKAPPAAAKSDAEKGAAKKPSTAQNTEDSVLQQFLAKMDASKHEDITWLYNAIRTRAPDLAPELQGKATLAFGGFDYETKSKCRGRWSRIGIMDNKTGLSLMVSGMKGGKYLLEHYDKKQIGKKASVGKSCIRFPTLDDVNRDVLEEIIVAAAQADVSPVAV